MRGFFSSMKSLVTGVVVDDNEEVTDLRGYWLRVQTFFQAVQKTSDDDELRALRQRLPEVEASLGAMIDILAKERKQFVVSLEDNAPDLPPCYEYMLRASSSAARPATGVRRDPHAHHSSNIDDGEHGAAAAGPTGDGRDIILSVCQYAKHDQPPGARSVMLHFLKRLFAEVDANKGSKSILHVSPEYVAMPLLNLLLKVGEVLDPASAPPPAPHSLSALALVSEVAGRVRQAGSSFGGKKEKEDRGGSSGGGGASAAALSSTNPQVLLHTDRLRLVELLAVLCEKVEMMPSTALHFFIAESHLSWMASDGVPTGARRASVASSSAATASTAAIVKPSTSSPGKAAAAEQQRGASPPTTAAATTDELVASQLAAQKVFLLPVLLHRYLHDSCVLALPHDGREQCVASALAGMLSLSKTASPVVQDVLIQSKFLRGMVPALMAAMSTNIVTMCKLPTDPEFPLWFRLSLVYMRFLDGLTLLSPHLAQAMLVPDLLRQNLLYETFFPLFLSSAESVLITSFSCFSALLREAVVSESCSKLLVEGLFMASISQKGAIVPLSQSGNSRGSAQTPPPMPLASDTTAGTGGAAEHRSLFTAILLPKMHDVADHISAAALFFFAALLERSPDLCLTYLLGIDGESTPCRVARAFLQNNQIAVVSTGILRINVDVNTLFPKRLVSSQGLCGTSTKSFNDDVLARLLRTESNCSPEELHTHRVAVATHASEPCCVPSPLLAAFVAARAAAQQPVPDDRNFFFSPAVNTMPFAQHLTDKLRAFTQNSFAVNAALTACVIATTLLPDIRCFLTLLDPLVGSITTALAKVRTDVDLLLDRDAAQTSAGQGAGQPIGVLGMFQRCAQRPFFDPDEKLNDERFAAAMRSSKVLVEACVCLEGFRHELFSAVGFIFVNQRLSELTQQGSSLPGVAA